MTSKNMKKKPQRLVLICRKLASPRIRIENRNENNNIEEAEQSAVAAFRKF